VSAERARALARARGLPPKKSFGQNFLRDRNIADKIAALATTPPGGSVLEIGAGLGALSEPLLGRAARVVAVERDRDLVPILREAFADSRLEIVEADAASLDWRAALDPVAPRPHVVAGNLPYQLSGMLIERAIHCARQFDRFVFMLQREVVERLAAAPGQGAYGALSVFVQAALSVRLALRVAPSAFTPAPKVDSAVVVMEPHPTPIAEEDAVFRAVVKGAFSQRRKKLRNCWRALEGAEDAAHAVGIDVNRRAETLSVEEFAAMAAALRRATLR
jgi:16S rRNA (adenine1518-N6/adenine1519-N6)-dimethyltransferase